MISQSRAWRALVAHREKRRAISPQDLFAADARRFEKLSFALDDLLLDFSKTALTEETIDLLADLAAAADLPARREAMFAGDAVNESENRAVLHTALRADDKTEVWRGGENAVAVAAAARADALDFAEKCRSGEIATAAGDTFSDVVNIGIGGSDLGPAMAAAALAPHCDGPRAHFVSNLDGAHLADTLAALDPRRTLLVVSSKTFTTIETLTNARAAIEWLARSVGRAAAAAHWVAVTAAPAQARAFGARRVFEYRDWVGGRCSLWGAVGLPVAIAVGRARFEEFLAGARALDAHFRAAPIRRNSAGVARLARRVASKFLRLSDSRRAALRLAAAAVAVVFAATRYGKQRQARRAKRGGGRMRDRACCVGRARHGRATRFFSDAAPRNGCRSVRIRARRAPERRRRRATPNAGGELSRAIGGAFFQRRFAFFAAASPLSGRAAVGDDFATATNAVSRSGAWSRFSSIGLLSKGRFGASILSINGESNWASGWRAKWGRKSIPKTRRTTATDRRAGCCDVSPNCARIRFSATAGCVARRGRASGARRRWRAPSFRAPPQTPLARIFLAPKKPRARSKKYSPNRDTRRGGGGL